MSILRTKQNPYLVLWLKLMCLAIVCMIFIGGYTRLTHSGLSITEWKPVTGIIPPLNDQEWALEFSQYQQSPEYIKINNYMNLSEFKSIFWIEFIHRFAGRLVGILYLTPLIFFLINGSIRGRDITIYLTGVVLLIGQGFAGWYMVKSGLSSDPHVSHFRLALHLLLAILLYALLFWQLMRNSFDPPLIGTRIKLTSINNWLNISLVALFIQIVLGAFVAGLNAGLIYNEFPLMGESFVPHEITLANLTLSSFSEPVFIQFSHRIMAYIVMTIVLVACFVGFKIKNPVLSKALICLMLALFLQVMLGIGVLVYSVPLIIALLHQLGAVIVLSCLLWAKYLVVRI